MQEIQRSPEEFVNEQFITPVLRPEVPAIIRSATDYSIVDAAVADVRLKRKKLSEYLKAEPADMKELRPAEGICFLTRKAWESANSLFNKFDSILKGKDEEYTGRMRRWQDQEADRVRREEERRSAEEEVKAEAERARLRAEAEAERKRLDEEAAKERARLDELARQARANKDKEEAARLTRQAQETELRLKREAEEREYDLLQSASRVQAQEVFVESRVPESTSMNTKKKYQGRVVDMTKFVRAVADGKYNVGLLMVNQSALNKLCDAMGGQNLPPGVVSDEVTTFSRKAVR